MHTSKHAQPSMHAHTSTHLHVHTYAHTSMNKYTHTPPRKYKVAHMPAHTAHPPHSILPSPSYLLHSMQVWIIDTWHRVR